MSYLALLACLWLPALLIILILDRFLQETQMGPWLIGFWFYTLGAVLFARLVSGRRAPR